MMQLPHGCRASNLSVSPKHWQNAKASDLQKDWYISYRFYDPRYPKPKLVIIKGMNTYKTVKARIDATQLLLDISKTELLEREYNPFTGHYIDKDIISDLDYIIKPETVMSVALDAALEHTKCSAGTKTDIKSSLKYFKEAAALLYLDQKPVKEISRRHIRIIFEQLAKSETWTAAKHNRYRKNISILFKTLVDLETIDNNPMANFAKVKAIVKKRKTLTDNEREKLDKELKTKHYRLWLFMQIFFQAGCRIVELMNVKASDVDITKQVFIVIKKKGRDYKEMKHVIRDTALQYWKEALEGCQPNQYLFSKGLKPGDVPIRRDQVTHRWYRHVKEGMGIDADLYSLKHSLLTDTAAAVGKTLASAQGNITDKMLVEHYDINSEARRLEALKKINTPFVKETENK